jgi:hypothetical protein
MDRTNPSFPKKGQIPKAPSDGMKLTTKHTRGFKSGEKNPKNGISTRDSRNQTSDSTFSAILQMKARMKNTAPMARQKQAVKESLTNPATRKPTLKIVRIENIFFIINHHKPTPID